MLTLASGCYASDDNSFFGLQEGNSVFIEENFFHILKEDPLSSEVVSQGVGVAVPSNKQNSSPGDKYIDGAYVGQEDECAREQDLFSTSKNASTQVSMSMKSVGVNTNPEAKKTCDQAVQVDMEKVIASLREKPEKKESQQEKGFFYIVCSCCLLGQEDSD